MKKYLSVAMFADKYGVAERTVRNYCANGKIEGAYLMGKTWNIPADAALPVRNKYKEQVMTLLEVLREQKQMRLKGSIYHRTQIDLTYNSNHIEGSRLTHDQTRYIFETNTIGVTDDGVKVDDIDYNPSMGWPIDIILPSIKKYEENRKKDRKQISDILLNYDIAISEQLGDPNVEKMRQMV